MCISKPNLDLAVLVSQMPLCYHPSLEYQLDQVPLSMTMRKDVIFPGIVKGKPRREAIVDSLVSAGITVKVG